MGRGRGRTQFGDLERCVVVEYLTHTKLSRRDAREISLCQDAQFEKRLEQRLLRGGAISVAHKQSRHLFEHRVRRPLRRTASGLGGTLESMFVRLPMTTGGICSFVCTINMTKRRRLGMQHRRWMHVLFYSLRRQHILSSISPSVGNVWRAGWSETLGNKGPSLTRAIGRQAAPGACFEKRSRNVDQ